MADVRCRASALDTEGLPLAEPTDDIHELATDAIQEPEERLDEWIFETMWTRGRYPLRSLLGHRAALPVRQQQNGRSSRQPSVDRPANLRTFAHTTECLGETHSNVSLSDSNAASALDRDVHMADDGERMHNDPLLFATARAHGPGMRPQLSVAANRGKPARTGAGAGVLGFAARPQSSGSARCMRRMTPGVCA